LAAKNRQVVPGREFADVDGAHGHAGRQQLAVRAGGETGYLALRGEFRHHPPGVAIQQLGTVAGDSTTAKAKDGCRFGEIRSGADRVGHQSLTRLDIPDHHHAVARRRQKS